ncbi:hypothetical protein [Halorussus litoreus]|uniref:hypothetical protein n=1 Tax=Halorussus litoreus TaxID=1710536 RepID=UPI000E245D4F|nr:hypothetical protein [Halorussus litoreus]
MRSQTKTTRALGLLAFAVGLVGYVFFGWRFGDGASNPFTVGLAILAVAVAVGVTLRDRL